jgi:hypothetical protein
MRHNGFFFPALRELTGKKSHIIEVRFEKLYIYQTGTHLPGRFIDAGAGNFGEIVDDRNTDFDRAEHTPRSCRQDGGAGLMRVGR